MTVALRIGGLFAGYGGLEMSVKDVLGGELAWYSEIDEAPSAILAHHNPDVPNLGDITTVDWSAVEPVDVLTGGFPCTDVSAAGKRAGLTPDTRSGLWAHMAYAIERLRPRVVVIENVRGLLTARGAPPTEELIAAWETLDRCVLAIAYLDRARDRAYRADKKELLHRVEATRIRHLGRRRRAVAAAKRADSLIVRAIGTVLGDLAGLGFDAVWCGLRAADVGAPHNRFRVFIVAADPNHVGHQRPGEARDGSARPEDDGVVAADSEGQRLVPRGLPVGEGTPLPDARLGGASPADAPGDGRDERRAESARVERGLHAAVSGGEPAPDAASSGRRGSRGVAPGQAQGVEPETVGSAGRSGGALAAHSDGGGLAGDPERDVTAAAGLEAPLAAAVDGRVLDWGQFGPAIERWRLILGRPAPAPTKTGKRGSEQLSPEFVEWMMGLPDGHVTAVPGLTRNEQLKALGNGVCPQQADAAVRFLVPLLAGLAEPAAA